MVRLFKKTSKKTGLSPGTVVHIGKKREGKVTISAIDYTKDSFKEHEIKNIEDCFPFADTPSITWINISGLHQTEIIEKLGNEFNLHPLTMEDIVNTGQRSKLEEYDEYLYLVLKMLYYEENKLFSEQISIIMRKNVIITFQEQSGDIFDALRKRISKKHSRIRKMKIDFLLYSILDAIVDNYFYMLEKMGEEIERLENELLEEPDKTSLVKIKNFKKETIFLRKSIWPLREVINFLTKSDSKLINKSTHLYLRDVYDHTIQVMDTIESFRDILSGFLDIYLSSVSNRMNEVMKTLTIIATIFIPLTFIAGIYGMNFKFMPELEWRWGYFAVWGLMIVIFISMIFYFKRKKWF